MHFETVKFADFLSLLATKTDVRGLPSVTAQSSKGDSLHHP